MSILDKLLGIPRTLDEFVDKAKRKGANRVDIKVETCYRDYDEILYKRRDESSSDGRWTDYQGRIKLQAGRICMRLNGHAVKRLYTHEPKELIARAKGMVEKATIEEAIGVAEKLASSGFKVTMGGKSVDEVREAVKQWVIVYP